MIAAENEVHIWATALLGHTIGHGADCKCEPDIIPNMLSISGEPCRVFIHRGVMMAAFGATCDCPPQG